MDYGDNGERTTNNGLTKRRLKTVYPIQHTPMDSNGIGIRKDRIVSEND